MFTVLSFISVLCLEKRLSEDKLFFVRRMYIWSFCFHFPQPVLLRSLWEERECLAVCQVLHSNVTATVPGFIEQITAKGTPWHRSTFRSIKRQFANSIRGWIRDNIGITCVPRVQQFFSHSFHPINPDSCYAHHRSG